MKIFKIIDEEQDLFIGTLLYYDKAKDFIIELSGELNEWNAPLLLTAYVKKGVFTIPRDISFLWVKERVIPSDRQNISAILDRHKLKQYDELPFLELSEGRCSQDHMYIKRVAELPVYVTERAQKNIKECVVLDQNTLLCFFEDNTTRKIVLDELAGIDGVEKICRNQMLQKSCRIGTGGYCITFNNSIDIPAAVLYRTGILISLELKDFVTFINSNVLDTTDSCNILECSRQNLSYLVKQEQLNPIRYDVKGNLYLKGSVLKNSW